VSSPAGKSKRWRIYYPTKTRQCFCRKLILTTLAAEKFSALKKINITKASGELAPFSLKKLRKSLRKAGAAPAVVDQIVAGIERELYPGMGTGQIYDRAFQMLREHSTHLAARYKLKKAIMELGPSGYPFEEFIGALLYRQRFDVRVGAIAQGRCVTHEIDVMATRNAEKIMVECKYHNQSGFLCDVKIPLYVHARFQDVAAGMSDKGQNSRFEGWVVTNTRFSDDAIRFGECAGLKLVGWDYPARGSLREMIDKQKLYPLTCLTTLTEREKNLLLGQNLVLCTDLMDREDMLQRVRIASERIPGILKECRNLCE